MNVRHDVVAETGCRSGGQEREDVRVLELSGDLDGCKKAVRYLPRVYGPRLLETSLSVLVVDGELVLAVAVVVINLDNGSGCGNWSR
jgi:hypothetical protein